MQKLIILGSYNALCTRDNEYTHMVFISDERVVLGDMTGNNPTLRPEQFEGENSENPHPLEACFCLDAGLGT